MSFGLIESQCGLSKGLPGWSALFTAIWYHAKGLKSPTTLIKQLRNLLPRFSLTALDPEFDLTCNLVAELDDHIPLTREDTRELLPVDQQDANFMITLFSCIFNSEPPPRGQSELICYPSGLVCHNTLVAQPESAPFLLVAAIERVWKKLGDPESGMTLRERILDSFEYAIRATMSMSIALTSGGERSKRITATVWTKLLHDVNILELTEEPNTYVCVAAGCITALDGVNHCTGIMILTRHIGMNASVLIAGVSKDFWAVL
ncbi:unnamed protein product [Rhizoctonia solani]|uniref:Uncharacterized protein n=1 Tax=Rhizoctonia solani TaxID=456999 RepID=A0A8H2ZYA3_9AGAM|nr:unnamed protein product [Rhizoctonia solani]